MPQTAVHIYIYIYICMYIYMPTLGVRGDNLDGHLYPMQLVATSQGRNEAIC